MQTFKFEGRQLNMPKTNEAFEKMSVEEKRVAIAKDVISGLKNSSLESSPGTWLKIPYYTLPDSSKEKQLQEVLGDIAICEVCAVGALFTSAVKRFNDMTCGELDPNNTYDGAVDCDITDIQPYLQRFFSSEQLALIELAYERKKYTLVRSEGMRCVADVPFDLMKKSMDSYSFIRSHSKRMIAIMKNIIKNKGEFVPLTQTQRKAERNRFAKKA